MNLLRFAVIGVVMAWTTASHAMVLRDGGFSIDIRGASVCIVSPPELRDDAACAGAAIPKAAPPFGPEVRPVAHGILRDPTTMKPVGDVQIVRTTGPEMWPDQKTATQVSEAFASDMAKALPPNAKARAGSAWVETMGETRIVRASVELDGVVDRSGRPMVGMDLTAVFLREGGAYVIVFSGARDDAAALKAISEQSIATITLDPKLRAGKNVSKLVGQLLVLIAMIIGGIAASFSYRTSQRRAQARRDASPPVR